MKKKHRKRNIILSVSFIAINIIVVVVIARHIFSDSTSEGFGSILSLWGEHWYFVLLAVLCPIIALLAEAIKFFIMIGKKIKKHRKRLALKTAIFGKYYDNVTPLGTGGQPFQIMYLYKYGISGPDSSLLPVASFVMNQFAFIILALIAFITSSHLVAEQAIRISAYVGSFFMIAMPLVVLFFTLFPVISRKLSVGILNLLHKMKIVKDVEKRIQKIDYFIVRFKTSFKQMSQSKKVMIPIFLFSLVYQIAIFSIPYFVIMALGIEVSYIEIFMLDVFIYSAIAYLPTPGNSGGAELIFTFIIPVGLLVGSQLFWSMLLWRFASYFLILIIGLLTLLIDFIIQQKNPVDIPEQERHRVIYPLVTLEDSRKLVFPDIKKGEL